MSPVLKRRLARKSQRGTTVLVVVMVTTLITAIGVFAVRNASQIDQAVGYSRQATQTVALSELGTSAAISGSAFNKWRCAALPHSGKVSVSAVGTAQTIPAASLHWLPSYGKRFRQLSHRHHRLRHHRARPRAWLGGDSRS